MEKIPSFQKDHNELQTGLHFCNEIHGVSTWDLRFKKPNGGDYLAPATIHTIEHLLATVLRNSPQKDDIIYFGPMGCRTGFYLLTTNLTKDRLLPLLTDGFAAALNFDTVPGNKKSECGNYLEHDLDGAKRECEKYLEILEKL